MFEACDCGYCRSNEVSQADRTVLQEMAGSLLMKALFAIRRANPGMNVNRAEELMGSISTLSKGETTMKKFIALAVCSAAVVLVVSWKWGVNLSNHVGSVSGFEITTGMLLLVGVGVVLHWAFKK